MAISDVSLTAGMRSNLTNLQSTVTLLNRTQERLASGKKVNSALDNPINFFTAKSHRSDAADLSTYKDGMNEGVQTLKQANNGITALTALIESAKALAASAKSKEAGTGYSTEEITFTGIHVADTVTTTGTGGQAFTFRNVGNTLTLTSISVAADAITIGGTTYTARAVPTLDNEFAIATTAALQAQNLLAAINLNTATTGITAAGGAAALTLTNIQGEGVLDSTISWVATGTLTKEEIAAASDDGDVKIGANEAATAANFAQQVNLNGTSAFRASSVNGATVTISGTATDVVDASITTTAASDRVSENIIAAVENERGSLATQYNEIQSQIADIIDDSGYAGTNLLKSGETLNVDFGNGHNLEVDGFNAAINVGNTTATNSWTAITEIDTDIAALDASLTTMRIQAANLSNNLSVISVRQDFSTSKINELIAGADNLTLADMNEEGANMLMLQTRQSLSTTALSLSAQASQSVLRLFQ